MTDKKLEEIKRMVKFISTLSPHNLERGEMALQEYLSDLLKQERNKVLDELIAKSQGMLTLEQAHALHKENQDITLQQYVSVEAIKKIKEGLING